MPHQMQTGLAFIGLPGPIEILVFLVIFLGPPALVYLVAQWLQKRSQRMGDNSGRRGTSASADGDGIERPITAEIVDAEIVDDRERE